LVSSSERGGTHAARKLLKINSTRVLKIDTRRTLKINRRSLDQKFEEAEIQFLTKVERRR